MLLETLLPDCEAFPKTVSNSDALALLHRYSETHKVSLLSPADEPYSITIGTFCAC